jgi:hypothetical protein
MSNYSFPVCVGRVAVWLEKGLDMNKYGCAIYWLG